MSNRYIVMTLGDPYGIGVEAVSYLLRRGVPPGISVIVAGSKWQWQWQRKQLGYSEDILWSTTPLGADPGIWFLDVGSEDTCLDPRSLSLEQRGRLSLAALEKVVQFSDSSKLAVLTSPIDKLACQKAGFSLGGQTEYFGKLWGGQPIMVLAGPKLRVGLATNHLALAEVSGALSKSLLIDKIEKFTYFIQQTCGSSHVSIGVCGLNPHASDGGMFGSEEAEIIHPAIEELRWKLGSTVRLEGPLPADTAFFRNFRGDFDGVVAMYHDQGLGPLKTVHFYDAVNISAGLKHLRVSPDHGPAADLFLTGRAKFDSFKEAWNLAVSHLER